MYIGVINLVINHLLSSWDIQVNKRFFLALTFSGEEVRGEGEESERCWSLAEARKLWGGWGFTSVEILEWSEVPKAL